MHGTPSHASTHASNGRLWTAVIVGPITWGAAGLLNWWVSAQACQDGTPGWGPLSEAGVRVVVAVIGLAALAATVTGIVVAARAWKASPEDPGFAHVEGTTNVAFLAAAGVLVGIAFAFGIVLIGLPSVMVGVCEFTR